MKLGPDQTFLKYEVRREIGRGGMGVVFEAWDVDLHRPVALKMLFPRLLADPVDAQRIVLEARAAAALCHPNIVRIHTLVDHDNLTVIDMEYVDGLPLNAVLRGGPLSPGRTVHILVQILNALEACHKRGMAHLDLKPSNILVTPEGHVYLTDFGLARAVASRNGLSLSGRTVCGTPRYAPPELWAGTQPTTSWDVFSAGVVAFECLLGIGSLNTEADAKTNFMRQLSSIEGLSPELSGLIERMLLKKAVKRPKDASEALVELRKAPEYQRANPVDRSSAPGTRERLLPDSEAVTLEARTTESRWFRRRVLTSALLLCLAGLIVFGVWFRHHRRDAPGTAPQDEDIAIQRGDSAPLELTMADGSLYFTADDGVHGRELWTAMPGPPRRVAEEGKAQNFTNPHRLFAAYSRLYFVAETPTTGSELYTCAKISGWPPIVKLLRDILPGAMGSDPHCVADHWPIMLFYANTKDYGWELWSAMGGEQQTGIVRDLILGPGGSMPEAPNFMSGKEFDYFLAYTDPATGIGLCCYDVASNTVRVLHDVSEDASLLGIIHDRLIFTQTDVERGTELWTSNAATSDTQPLLDILPGPASSNPRQSCVLGDRVLFQATTSDTGDELWTSDGTAEGTHLLCDIRPGPEGSAPQAFSASDTFASFRADDGTHGPELWATDGTSKGTMLVKDVRPGRDGSYPYNNVSRKSYLAFSANDGKHGEELWLAKFKDGRWTAELVMDIAPGPANSEPRNLVWSDDAHAFFSATAPDIGRELFELCAEPINPPDVISQCDLRPRPGQVAHTEGRPR